ncbi:MAG: hypothetical protein PW843_24280 [Azospirillaceae bacterium]|nr:hypothetical protein [Azospirillaceae bacterium]
MDIRAIPEQIGAQAVWDGGDGLVEAGYVLDCSGLVMVVRRRDGGITVPVSLPRLEHHQHDAVALAVNVMRGVSNHMPVAAETLSLAAAVVVLADRLQGVPLTPALDGSGLVQAVPS